MKLNKIILPLMLALAAMLATTGCKKGFNGVTPLYGSKPGPIGGEIPGGTLSSGSQLGQETPPTTTAFPTGPIPLPDNRTWDPKDTIQEPMADQTVHFAFDSAAVQSKEESKIIIVSEKLKSDPSALMWIQGNCDERGTEEYNRALGERRALALREALIRSGIEVERVQTISFGKDKPVDTGHDESTWAANRRGDFILCHRKPGA
jgi:peptidoglycan-associated lipoprotein